jgi:hypothetical protein
MKRPSEIDPVAAKQAIMIAEFLTRLAVSGLPPS